MTGRSSRSPALISGLLAIGLLWTAGAPAFAQDLQTQVIIDRLNRLERSISDLERQFYRGEAPPPSAAPAPVTAPSADGGTGSTAVADHERRIARLEEEIGTLTGSVEEFQHGLNRLNNRLDKLVADIDYRLKAIESRAATAPAPIAGADTDSTGQPGEEAMTETAGAGTSETPEPMPEGVLGTIPADTDITAGVTESEAGPETPAEAAVEAETTALAPGATPQEQYDHAFNLLRRADYDGAEAALSSFVAEHPDLPLASNAFYWLGEAYYVRQNYEQAAITFLRGYKAFPEGNKAPDSLLKLGMTLDKLGNQNDACATLDKLLSDFPDAATTIRNRATQERRNIGCT
ncbi:MAG: tol-pal system protein YbgF [Rhodospirillaceae bacterium]|nr:tol-pal system protein YbgF [Rhodospirillaceae bacterium]